MALNGPARGDAALRTAFSPTGAAGRGTINNCGDGYAIWGWYLPCEENWAGYFRRPSSDNVNRTPWQVVAFNRYGVTSATGANSWSTVVPSTPGATRFAEWNAVALGCC